MVLTNFECWAHGGSNDSRFADNNVIMQRRTNMMDLFNPTTLQTCNNNNNTSNATNDTNHENESRCISHLSSNGYYGFVPQIYNNNNNNNTNNENVANAEMKTTPAMENDVTHTNTNTDHIMMMDVEQHFTPINNIVGMENSDRINKQQQQINEHNYGKRISMENNGSNNRRKRFFIEENDDYSNKRFYTKRTCFENQQNFLENHAGFPSSYAPNTTFNMDHDDIPVIIPNLNYQNQYEQQLGSFGNAPIISTPSTILHTTESRISEEFPSNTFKSNSTNNNKYRDIYLKKLQ